MKQLPYLLLALMLSFVSASAQTLDVAPYDASHFNGVSYVNPHNLHRDTIDIHWSDTTLFLDKQKSFLFGYHWGGGDNTVMERRWHINAPHDGNPAYNEFDSTNTDFETALPGRTVHYIPRHDVYDWFVEHHLYTPLMEWRPAITGWRSEGESFSPVPSDSTGAIFGFEERAVGVSQTDSSQPHFMDYVVRTSDLDSVGTPVLALRRPVWRAFPMRRGNAVSAKTDTTSAAYHEAQWNGTRWYAAINLGRLNNDSLATDSIPVASIKIRYWYYSTSDSTYHDEFIRFDSVFVSGQSSTVSTGRGKTFGHLTPAVGDSTAFIIRRSDLPAYSANDTSGMITLAAFFRTSSPVEEDEEKQAPNPWFKIENGEVNAVDSFDIQVTYHGGCDIAVRHISLQTPTGRSVLFGGYDTVIARNIDRAVRQFRRWQSHYPTKTLRLFRFYGVDEAPRYNWRMHRYYNKLMDKRLTTEVDHDAYRHAVPQRDYWSGSSATVLWRQNAPFVNKFYATPDAYMPTHPGGWLDAAAGITPYNYECRHCEDGNHIRWEGYPWITGRSFPNVGMAHLNSFGLCLFESLAAIYALTPLTLYSPTPNWTRHTLTKWYTYGIHIQKVDGDTVYRPYFHPDGYLPREQTGEEVRRAMWYSVLMGTKGLNIADGTGGRPSLPHTTRC